MCTNLLEYLSNTCTSSDKDFLLFVTLLYFVCEDQSAGVYKQWNGLLKWWNGLLEWWNGNF